MEWTALENQIMQNRCKLLEMCFQDSLKKPCRMLTSFAVLSPRFVQRLSAVEVDRPTVVPFVRGLLSVAGQ